MAESKKLSGLNPLAYIGVDALSPPDLTIQDRRPTTGDHADFNLGTFWIYLDADELWVLLSKAGATAQWKQLAAGGGVAVLSLAGNTGGSVGPTGGGLINVIGSNVIAIAGNPGTNTLTGTLTNGANGQLLIGGGANPLWANLTSTGATITITSGANSINLEAVGGGGANSFPTDSGTATPAAGVLSILGGLNLNTSASGSTVTVKTDTALTGLTSITLAVGGALRTGTSPGNTALLQAYDVDGGFYLPFAILRANNVPTMDLTDSVTKGGQYIYRVGGNDVSVEDGGTGRSLATAYSVLCGGTTTTNPHQSVASVGTSGQVLTSNGATALPTFQAASPAAVIAFQGVHFSNTEGFTVTTNPQSLALGSVVAMTELFDTGNNFFPGNSAGTGASFTAPTTGLYCFQMCMAIGTATVGLYQGGVNAGLVVTGSIDYQSRPLETSTVLANNEMTCTLSVVITLNASDVVSFVIRTYITPTLVVQVLNSEGAFSRSWVSGFKVN